MRLYTYYYTIFVQYYLEEKKRKHILGEKKKKSACNDEGPHSPSAHAWLDRHHTPTPKDWRSWFRRICSPPNISNLRLEGCVSIFVLRMQSFGNSKFLKPRTTPSGGKVTGSEERGERKMLKIVATKFCMLCPRAAHTLHTDQFHPQRISDM